MKFRIFPYAVAVAAFLIAGSAAFFSVFGLSKLFAGASISVMIMAGSLEFGKLVSASFLYRYWTTMNKIMRVYLSVGVIILVLITSAGIFGYLSNAYQGATVNFEKETSQLIYLTDRLEQLKDDKLFLEQSLKASIAELPDNYMTAKRKLREDYNPQIIDLNGQILDIKNQVSDLKLQLIDTGVDVGPAIYLAQMFNAEINTVVKFFIFILIFVFDPMAVILVIAANMIFLESIVKIKSEKKTKSDLMDNLYDTMRKKKKLKVYGEDKENISVEIPKKKLPEPEISKPQKKHYRGKDGRSV